LRILHAAQFYPPSVGGVQEVVRQISERLAARGHDVTVATTRIPGRARRDPKGVHIEEFEVKGNGAGAMWGDVSRYRRFVAEGRFDVVMSYAAQQWSTDALLDVVDDIPAARVLAPCGFSGLYQRRYRRYFARLPELLRRWDALVFHGNAYRDIEFARNAGLDGLVVIPNGADEREFAEPTGRRARFRAQYGIPAEVPVLLSVSSHTGRKGHAALLQGFGRLPREAVLVLIGNPAGRRGCARACRRRAAVLSRRSHGSHRVLLIDPPRDEVIDAYFAADIFVLASEVECSPLVLFEAAAAGLPVVTVPVGNAKEILEATRGGVVVPAGRRPDGDTRPDPAALASAISELLNQPERRQQMGARARAVWQRDYTWSTLAKRYEDLYTRLTAARRDAARRS
jgi:glycosyltransferase involved in cell wall biosynthesis